MLRLGMPLAATILLSACSMLVENKLDGRGETRHDGGSGTDGGLDGGTDAGLDAGPDADVWFTHCGNGTLEPELGEQCEPGNEAEGEPACSPECTFPCTDDEDCPTANLCLTSRCDVEAGACVRPSEVDCDDADACTIDSCNPGIGCLNLFLDEDRDGFAPTELGTCKDADKSGDCDDDDPTSNPGAVEECDDVDHDCSGSPTPDDEIVIQCQRDADGDGFGDLSEVEPGCTCPPGFIQPRADERVDCNDQNAEVFPGQSRYFGGPYCPGAGAATNGPDGWTCVGTNPTFDYDCDGNESPEFATVIDCSAVERFCSGSGWPETVAPCGAEEKWATCSPRACNPLDLLCGRDECLASITTQVQTCR